MKLLVCAKTALAPANKQSTMNSAPTKYRRAAFPLPLGEGQGEGAQLAAFPLPLGEGQGEGAQLREKGKKNVGVVSVLANPSPQPSPKGRGRLEDSDSILAADKFLAHRATDRTLMFIALLLRFVNSASAA